VGRDREKAAVIRFRAHFGRAHKTLLKMAYSRYGCVRNWHHRRKGMPDEQSFEQMKYDLERQKLAFEEKKYERDNTFFNKNFGVIITALVSLATIVVSGSGIWIGRAYNEAQLENAKNQSDRTFAFGIAKFMLDKGDDITTTNPTRARYIQTAVIAFFPDGYRAQIARSMRDLAPDRDVKSAWGDVLEYLQNVNVQSVAAGGATTLKIEDLTREFPQLAARDKAEKLRAILNQAPRFGISNKNDTAIYLAMIFFNTNFLQIDIEDLNYSAQRLLAIWPSRFATIDDAKNIEHDSEKIANLVYGNRMGNRPGSGDGFNYRGRGYMLITGRESYRNVGQKLGLDLEAKPEMLLDPEVNAKAAAYVFMRDTAQRRKNGQIDLIGANVAINGGIVGLSEMRATFDRIQKL
jgi:putative chitinase